MANIDLMFFKSLNSTFEKPLDPKLLQHINLENFDRLYFTLTQSLNLNIITKKYELWLQFNENLASHLTAIKDILLYASMSKVLSISIADYECLCALRGGDNLLLAAEKALKLKAKFNLNDFLNFCFKNDLIINFKYDI